MRHGIGAGLGLAGALALTGALTGAAALAGGLPPPVTDADYRAVDERLAAIGQLLFYDPVLSGNRTISCATCHHPRHATADGVALSLGEGGVGLGPARVPDPANLPEQRIPRNAPALFNLGATEFTVLFHDGRIEADPSRPGGLRTPMDEEMMAGFDSLLSAQTMFPVLSPDEMAGHYSENEVAQAVRLGIITGEGGAWDRIAARVRAIPAYRDAFAAALPEVAAGRPVGFTDISNAIAAFMALEWRADDSAFDRHLRGEAPLEGAAARGMALFYGTAGCDGCHAGRFQTDHRFHATGAPQIGPGKGNRHETHARDEGRMRVTGRPEDAYAFRTPSLRNVALTAPYGHAGAHADLPGFLAAHLDPVAALAAFDPATVALTPLPGENPWRVPQDPEEMARIAAAVEIAPRSLSAGEIADLVAFLESLSDPDAIAGRFGVPAAVPSGLAFEK
jgi:cytochrome c peroxidase